MPVSIQRLPDWLSEIGYSSLSTKERALICAPVSNQKPCEKPPFSKWNRPKPSAKNFATRSIHHPPTHYVPRWPPRRGHQTTNHQKRPEMKVDQSTSERTNDHGPPIPNSRNTEYGIFPTTANTGCFDPLFTHHASRISFAPARLCVTF